MDLEKKYKCAECGQTFYGKDLVEYVPFLSRKRVPKPYCVECLEKKKEKEWFIIEICKIFRIKAPGPKINAQKQRLNNEGFTDEVIIRTLHYMFEVKKMNKKYETLGLVNLENAKAAERYYKREEEKRAQKANDLTEMKMKTYSIKTREKEEKPQRLNPLDFLGDED